MTEIPKSAVTRAAKLASLPLGFAGRTALGVGRRVTGAASEIVSADVQRRTAEHLFSVLGQLKGGAMKVGQLLSILEAALPEDLAEPYREALTRLQDAAPPMSKATVHKILADNLGTKWERRFASFDDHPAAAASIGQVHKAIWKDGRVVAVKLQYPGAGSALVSDLNQLTRLASAFKVIQPGLDIKPLVAELRERITEELDYAREARNQQTFAEAYADHPEFLIPKVIDSGPTVLISDWIDGTPLSTIIASGSDDDRNLAGLRIATLHFSAPAKVGLLHADPHPGNFRLLDDGRLGVLDFGAAAALPGGIPEPIGRSSRFALAGDAEAVLEGLRAEGFVRPGSPVDAQMLLEFIRPMLEPLNGPEFHFCRSWLRAQATRMADPRGPGTTLARQLMLPPSYLLIHKVTLGSMGVLCQLNATASFRSVIEQWLPGFVAPDKDADGRCPSAS